MVYIYIYTYGLYGSYVLYGIDAIYMVYMDHMFLYGIYANSVVNKAWLLPNAANSRQLKPESFQMLQIACNPEVGGGTIPLGGVGPPRD